MPIEEVNEILLRYKKAEQKADDFLQKHNTSNIGRDVLFHQNLDDCLILPSEEEALERNAALLKELKTIKGNLRSKAIYSPVEMRWEQICKNYLENPTLPITSWKCRLPVFV